MSQTGNLKPLPTEISESGKRKFTSEEIQQIILWIAEFKSNEEIYKLVQTSFGKTISYPGLQNYKSGEKWQPLIRKHREAWGREIFNIELAHKRRRLEELSEIYRDAREKEDLKLSMDALLHIKNETEKELGNLHLYNIRIYKSMSDEELETERLKTLEEIKRIKEITHASQIGSTEAPDGSRLLQSFEGLSEEQGGSLDVKESAS